ncbi:amidohydrolase family protein [Testudinibacter aquarius]|uniref:Putative TIM-barrel fold metal-dependent hydrolase n=1 Tax=Testudinibacter aquarius TaxID=1524974 RepID=A0A4R3YCY0_9PAST|nr:amidohydrolase family protein [Testudinibacter aquarius]KAE9529368.1 thioesterase [Testudinibacter aquarius]TCV89886.1 putative TIM-barrel fold metal-dependent hydrolase [Testudinibacter aquarius]TNG93740.1 thioesterase [Testudinibacter aquarius]
MQTKLYDGPMIDAHQHFWQPQINPHPWLAPDILIPFRYGDYSSIKCEYLPPDYLKDATPKHNVVATVYIDAEWDPKDPIGETKYIHTVAEKYGMPNAVVAQAWLHADDVEAVLKEQSQYPLVRSVRHKPAGALSPAEAQAGIRTLMSDDKWRQGYELLAKLGLNFDLQTPWWNLHEAKQLALDFPNTLIILNHTGLPSDRSPEGLAAWHKAMASLSDIPNIVVKISGIGLPDKKWDINDNRWIVQETVQIFGTERTMFASNFPVDSLCGNLETIFTGFKEAVKDYSYVEQHKLFFANAKKYYKINI